MLTLAKLYETFVSAENKSIEVHVADQSSAAMFERHLSDKLSKLFH